MDYISLSELTGLIILGEVQIDVYMYILNWMADVIFKKQSLKLQSLK